VIGRQTGHLARLVDDLLDVTRVARGKIALRRARIDLREIVTRTGEDFCEVIAARGLRFRCTAPDRSVWVDADATRIAQIIGNLLHNATKFTRPADEVVLSLEVRGGHAELRVRDTGAGIEPDLVAQVFDAFVQGQRTIARTEGGLGLGLALVKGIAELHGGSVHAASEGKGKGAEFLVRLPLLEPGPAEAPGAGGGPRAAAPHRNGRRRVLVVDDNVDAARSLADVVELLGHAAEVAHDGPSAIAKVHDTAPDVVLCDLGLPGMSGYDVARALRAAATPARLLAVSGYAQPDDVTNALAAGFHGHLAKPVSLQEIERLLT
jgi:CheY-like chemotaxis protein